MWLTKSPMLDGSGTYLHHGVEFKIAVQDLVSAKHRVAFRDGKEVARAGSFPALLRKLDRLFPESELDKCECGLSRSIANNRHRVAVRAGSQSRNRGPPRYR